MQTIPMRPPSVTSSVLTQFARSPFRIFRLEVGVGLADALLSAQRAMVSLRAGRPQELSDPLPWLRQPTVPEAHEALQKLEGPLTRMAEQLLWFDFEGDSDGEFLRGCIASLSKPDVDGYLAAEPIPDDRADGDDVSSATITGIVNRANLRLLLAGAILARRGSADSSTSGDGSVTTWETDGDLMIVANPHRWAEPGGRASNQAESAAALWKLGLRAWLGLFAMPGFDSYLIDRLNALGPESIDEGDAEVLRESVQSRIQELLIEEIQSEARAGRFDAVAQLASSIGQEEFDPRPWALAFRPLRTVFGGELDDLLSTVDREGTHLADIGLVLKRLEGLVERWKAIDRKGVIGLRVTADSALERLASRTCELAVAGREDAAHSLLVRMRELASAESVRQRIAGDAAAVQARKDRLCYFCQAQAADLDSSLALEGKRETHRTYSGNTTTVHYLVSHGLVPRCDRCKQLHSFVESIAWRTALCTIPGGLLLGVLVTMTGDCFPIGIGAGIALVWGMKYVVRWFVAGEVTPGRERNLDSYMAHDSAKKLRSEGFAVTPLWNKEPRELM